MLMPKRVKHRKQQRGRRSGQSKGSTNIDFGEFGLKALQDAGFSIALDDFGMGYSEFNQLRALPYDVIKIDKSYICALGTDHVTDVFVSAVVEIARRCGKYVVAEGIETEDDLLRARAAGCDRFQGYYFGKPVFLEEISRDRMDYGNKPAEYGRKQSVA